MFNSSANNLLFKLIKNQPIYPLISLILSLSSTILNLISTTLLIPILFILLGNIEWVSTSNYPLYINDLFDLLNNQPAEYQLSILTFIVCLSILLKNSINYINTISGLLYTKSIVFQMKNQGLSMLCKADLNYYRKNKISSILLKLNRDIEKTALGVKSMQNIVIISITILLLTIILIVISWQLSLIALTLIYLIVYLNNWLLNQLTSQRILASVKTQEYNRQVIEFLSGIRLIKTVANESAAHKAIAQSIRDKDQKQLKTQFISATMKPVVEIGGMIVVLTLGVSSYYLYPLPISEIAPIVLIYLVVLFRLLHFVSQFNSTKLQFINARSSIEIVANFLHESDKAILSSDQIIFTNLQRGIEFQAVTFAYPQHAQIVLDKINLLIPQGQTIALVGFMGAGKSTIADLLMRFYEPIEGKILIDNRDLKEYDSVSLKKAIAVISRNTFLFNNSLAYNIAYGVSNATSDDITFAAKKAQIYQFIIQLPAGFSTVVGERGITLTENQKQKISLARAFLRNSQILIWDEPIDGYDRYSNASESIQELIASLRNQDRTTVIITKHLNLARKADRIIVFNRSRIVETGTHEKLLQQGGIYQRLYSMQFRSSQQSHQLKLAQKIAQKLAQQTNTTLSLEISSSLDTLLNYLEMINEGLFNDEQEQNKILDQSYQSAKNVLLSLKEYEQKILREYDQENS